jgi:site-specific DNA-cytosine methylase
VGKPFTGVTLFSGAGLFESGLADAVEFVHAVEYNEAIAAHYASVWGNHVQVADVSAVDYRPFAGVDLLHASPSCKKASVANADRGETPEDRSAGKATERAIVEIRPRCFTLENVIAYRDFDAYKGICRTLTEQGYTWDAQVLNSADFSVPQTRRRLYLRAWLKRDNLPILSPTHCERGKLSAAASIGDLFAGAPLLPWNGWYGAIEDLIPTLPESAFAQWQLDRLADSLPEDWTGSVLVHPTDMRTMPNVASDQPAFTVMAGSFDKSRAPSWKPRAFIVDGQETTPGQGGKRLAVVRHDSEPSITVTASASKGMARAFLVHGSSTMEVRQAEEPSACVMATVGAKAARPRAFLVGVNGERGELYRPDKDPAQTVTANHNAAKLRALLERGRVVSMSDRCLARFQGLADWYVLSTNKRLNCMMIGNGVSPPMARVVALPLLMEMKHAS